MADNINKLPTDQNVPNQEELHTINTVFKENKKGIKRMFGDMKDAILAGILFGIMSIPQVDNLIKSLISSANNSWIILIGIKIILFIIIFYVIKNFAFAKKN